MSLEPWDEIRTALHVARAGTVSGAATALGVHHATVIRHIDALEDRINAKLFQRHAKGYTPTEAGRALFEAALETEQRFEQLAARLQTLQGGISGALVITTIPELSAFLLPAISELCQRYPALVPCLRTEERVLRLEYGEAHVALRAGAEPREPDNVVQSLGQLAVALYASPALGDIVDGKSEVPLEKLGFVAAEGSATRAPAEIWLRQAGHRITFRSNDHATRLAAIRDGLGAGFLLPGAESEGLIQIRPPRPEWASALWLVTHVDLHRSPKVQACTTLLREHMTRGLTR